MRVCLFIERLTKSRMSVQHRLLKSAVQNRDSDFNDFPRSPTTLTPAPLPGEGNCTQKKECQFRERVVISRM
jgi:hypothetical protein